MRGKTSENEEKKLGKMRMRDRKIGKIIGKRRIGEMRGKGGVRK